MDVNQAIGQGIQAKINQCMSQDIINKMAVAEKISGKKRWG